MGVVARPWVISLGISIAIHAIVLQVSALHLSPLIIGIKSENTAQHEGLLSIPTIAFVSSAAVKNISVKNSSENHNAIFFKPIVNKKNITDVHSSSQKLNSEQRAKKSGKKPQNFPDKPALLKFEAPALSYPTEALAHEEQGIVVLRAGINTKGDIVAVQLLKSSGFTDLDQAALRWFAQLKFMPAYKQGVPINSFLLQKINFNLREIKN
ncbi:MAG: energy transducer TonB [Rickettsiella sp.]|nr:energy transducer TonB [Rickettsiella sp.]